MKVSRYSCLHVCRTRLKESIVAVLQVSGKSSDLQLDAKPAVLLIVGVNGGGKTTTIGKLAHKFGSEGAKACHATCLCTLDLVNILVLVSCPHDWQLHSESLMACQRGASCKAHLRHP